MKAVVATPGGEQPVAMREVADPVTDVGEALVQVEAISLNRGDLQSLSTPEARPGWDVAGTVLAEAADGSGPKAGTRVVGVVRGGGWAEKVAVPTGQLAAISPELSASEASTLGIAGLTALRTIRIPGSVCGRRVLVTGGSGGVGRFAIQLGTLYGADVTATVSRPERADGLKGLGAANVVVDGEELPDRYDLVIDGVGGPALQSAVRAAADGALILSYGVAAGRPAELVFADFRGGRGASLRGFFVWQTELATFGRDLEYLAKLARAGVLDTSVALELDWTDFASGVTALLERRVGGKVTFRVGS